MVGTPEHSTDLSLNPLTAEYRVEHLLNRHRLELEVHRGTQMTYPSVRRVIFIYKFWQRDSVFGSVLKQIIHDELTDKLGYSGRAQKKTGSKTQMLEGRKYILQKSRNAPR